MSLTTSANEFTICDEMNRQHLTDFELMILLAILRIGENAYGVPIAKEIEQTGKRSVLLGAIYAALDRLEDNGLVASAYGDPTPERGGRAKRFFKVTPRGLKAVKDTQRAFTALWTGIPQLKGGTA
jgi:DNA-binding PadR family transcriptional regulator